MDRLPVGNCNRPMNLSLLSGLLSMAGLNMTDRNMAVTFFAVVFSATVALAAAPEVSKEALSPTAALPRVDLPVGRVVGVGPVKTAEGDASPGQPSKDNKKRPMSESVVAGADTVAGDDRSDAMEREETTMEFVQAHHPELAKLLETLKRHRPATYERAIRDLSRTSDRLAMLRVKQAIRYETELQTWKLNSKIQLLTAKLALKETPQLREALRAALIERHDQRRQYLLAEQKRLQTRSALLERELERQNSFDADRAIDQLLQKSQIKKTSPDKPGKEAP